jgi:hypothetical protein
MIPIEIQDGRVLIHAFKELVVLTKVGFIQALMRGKAWRRRQALEQRIPPATSSRKVETI